MERIATPELDKIQANRTESQSIGDFLDWLRNDHNLSLCKYDEKAICEDCEEEVGGYISSHLSVEQLLAQYFGVDLNKAEEERQALLAQIRENNQDT